LSALVLCVFGGCAEDPMLIVTVQTDLVPGESFNRLVIEVTGASIVTNDPTEPRVSTVERGASDMPTFPFSFVLVPSGQGDPHVRVAAYVAAAGAEATLVVDQVGRVGFPSNGTRVMRMRLDHTCVGLRDACTSEETCVRGACTEIDRWPHGLPRVVRKHELDGIAAPPSVVLRTRDAVRGARYNSQLELQKHISFGDVDNDGDSELLQWTEVGFFATQLDGEGTGLAHSLDGVGLTGIIPGDFMGRGRDEVCARLLDKRIHCLAISDDRDTFWGWFSQLPSFDAIDDIIVGDFDANGKDDVLVHVRQSGRLSLLAMPGGAGFESTQAELMSVPTWFDRPVRIRAADFSGDGRTDLLLVDAHGRMSRYDSRDASGNVSFNEVWSTSESVVSPDEEVLVAVVDTDVLADVHVHDLGTGRHRFFRAELDDAQALVPIDDIEPPTTLPGAIVRWVRTRDAAGLGGRRDDLVVLELATDTVRTLEATFDRRHTYVEGIAQSVPTNDEWPAPRFVDWHGLACRFSDVASAPNIFAGLTERMEGYGNNVVRATFGLVRLRAHAPSAWLTTDLTASHINDAPASMVDRCLAVSSAMPGENAIVSAFWNGVAVQPRSEGRLGVVPYAALSSDIEIAATRLSQSLFRQLDLSQTHAGQTNPLPEAGDFAMNGVERLLLIGEDRIPPSRIVELRWNEPRALNVRIAALNRAETTAPLMVRVRLEDGRYYTVELRTPLGYGFVTETGVTVHELRSIGGRPTSVRVLPESPGVLPLDQAFSVPHLTVTVRSIHASGTWADLEIDVH
jgi:hypothetical protein